MSNHDEGVDLEEQFFHAEDEKKIAALKAKAEAEKAAAAAAELKALHHLHCGKCGTKMDTQIFKGVEIEVCPNCGSVLLDPGELEELVGDDDSGVLKTVSDFFSFSRRG